MSVPTAVAADLDARLELRVVAGLTALPNLTRPLVYVAGQTITPGAWPHRVHELGVWLLAPEADPVKADATLDAHIDEVLDALEDDPVRTWTRAERAVFGGDDGFHAWHITVNVPTKKE